MRGQWGERGEQNNNEEAIQNESRDERMGGGLEGKTEPQWMKNTEGIKGWKDRGGGRREKKTHDEWETRNESKDAGDVWEGKQNQWKGQAGPGKRTNHPKEAMPNPKNTPEKTENTEHLTQQKVSYYKGVGLMQGLFWPLCGGQVGSKELSCPLIKAFVSGFVVFDHQKQFLNTQLYLCYQANHPQNANNNDSNHSL